MRELMVQFIRNEEGQDVVEYGGRWLIVRPSGRLVR